MYTLFSSDISPQTRRGTTFLLLLVVIGFIIQGSHPESGGIFIAELLLLLAMYTSRVLIIAVKYGYMPTCDYNVMMHGTTEDAGAVQNRQQLLTGWVNPSDASLRAELAQSAARYRMSTFWTHLKQNYVFCDVSVREEDWGSHVRGAQAT
jgi:hypothetical protein